MNKEYRIISKISFIAIISLLALSLTSCKKDDPKQLDNKSELVQKVDKLLSGKIIVLGTTAKAGTTDKTLLEGGCPAKYYFKYHKSENKLEIDLKKFQVGNMPFAVVFKSKAELRELNNWDREEYPEAGWLKFYADNGEVTPFVPEGEKVPEQDGAGIVEGFVNPLLGEIEFFMNYNMMNVTSHCYRQKINFNRLAGFDKEFHDYEVALKKYKKEHGL